MSGSSFSERVQYLAARLTAHLPERVQTALSGQPPLVVDGQRFDAHAQLLRNVRRGRIPDGLIQPSVEAGRRRYRRETRAFRGPVTEVGAVRDFEIAGPAGPLRLRHYAPSDAAEPARHLTVYLHGGGYVIGDLDTHDEPCRLLCRHAGVDVLSVEYRLAPEHPFPAALEDTLAALRWAQSNAALGGALRVSIGGDSAGANLAAVAARLATREGAPPTAQLLIYPVTDSVTDRRSYALFGEGHLLTMTDREDFRRCYLEGSGTSSDDPRVSPLLARDLGGLPAALVITAGFDLLRDEGEAYADALAAAGNVVRRQRVSDLGHGFIHMTGVCRAARRAVLGIAAEWRALLSIQRMPEA